MSLRTCLSLVVSTSIFFALPAATAAAAEPTADQAADLKKMQAKWGVVSFESKEGDDPELNQSLTIAVKGTKFEMHLDGVVELTYEMAIDPEKSPKEIAFTYDGNGTKETRKGIYSFDGETWKLCWNDAAEDVRPKMFSIKESPQFCLLILKPKPDAPAAKPDAPAEKPAADDEKKPFEIIRIGAAGLAVPTGWRGQPILPRFMLHSRQGDGIGVPAADEAGKPLQIGLSVERVPVGKDSLDKGAEILAKTAKANRRLEIVGKESIEKLKLADGSEAALLTMEFIKEEARRSLQLKLLVKDDKENGWIVSAFLVGGKESKLPTAKSDLALWLRAIVLTFCLDGTKVDAAKLKALAAAAK